MIKNPNITKTVPEETIKRVNLTGISDEELFGPDFLYKEKEVYKIKKIIPMNPVTMNHTTYDDSSESEDENDYDDDDEDEEVQCVFCGLGVLSEDEQNHINTMHREEDDQINDPIYSAPKTEDLVYKSPKYEAPDAEELRKLKRELRDMNGAMNDFSKETVEDMEKVKLGLASITDNTKNIGTQMETQVQNFINEMCESQEDVVQKVSYNDEKVSRLEESVSNYAETNAENKKSMIILSDKFTDLNKFQVNVDNNMDRMAESVNKVLKTKEKEQNEIAIKFEAMENMIGIMEAKLSANDIEDLRDRVNKESEIVKEAKNLIKQLTEKNIQTMLKEKGICTFDYENEDKDFIPKTEEIEIKMEIPSAPSEEVSFKDKIIKESKQKVPFKESMIKTEVVIEENMTEATNDKESIVKTNDVIEKTIIKATNDKIKIPEENDSTDRKVINTADPDMSYFKGEMKVEEKETVTLD